MTFVIPIQTTFRSIHVQQLPQPQKKEPLDLYLLLHLVQDHLIKQQLGVVLREAVGSVDITN